MLAGAGHRLHLIWHTVRGGWLRGLRTAQKRDIHRFGWAPGAPSSVDDARAARRLWADPHQWVRRRLLPCTDR